MMEMQSVFLFLNLAWSRVGNSGSGEYGGHGVNGGNRENGGNGENGECRK